LDKDRLFEFFKKGMYKEIVEFFHEHVPEDQEEYILDALSYYNLGLVNDAVRTLKVGLISFPGDKDLLFNIVEILYNANMFDEAEKYAVQAINVEPDNYVYYDILATIYFSRNDKENGLRILKNALKYAPDNLVPQLIDKYSSVSEDCLYAKKYGFFPPPSFADISGYEVLLDTIIKEKLYLLEGDIVEIGAFLGGGTYKLSKLMEALGVDKIVYAIDTFDFRSDESTSTSGERMSDLYGEILKGRNQFDIYSKITMNCKNVVTLISDSKNVVLPCDKVCFAYIDGNHSPDYVRNDFYLVWNKLVSHGVVSFDDYGYDLPQVTKTIHKLIGEESERILKLWTAGGKRIFIEKE